MKRLSLSRLIVSMLIITAGLLICDTISAQDRAPKPEKKGLFGLFSGKKSNGKVTKPQTASQVQKEQAKKKKQEDADYAKSLKASQKRTYEIQTPEVKARMKQNEKEVAEREKAKKKKTSASTKKAGRKYKK
jgi:hypothetical protein